MKKFSVKPRLTHSKRALVGNDIDSHESVFIGRLAEAGQLVRVDFDLELPHVIAIFGKRGSGKSYTLGSFLEGLCTKESQTSISSLTDRRAGLLFDTLGIFQWFGIPVSQNATQKLLQEQALAQKGWDIRTEPLNVEIWAPRGTATPHSPCKEFTIDCSAFTASDWGYLFGVDILQDRMGQLLNDVYEKVVNEGWSDGKSTFSPHPKYVIEDLMDCAENDRELIANYHSETRRAVSQLLSVYWRNPLFQPKRRNAPNATVKADMSAESSESLKSVEGTALTALLRRGQLSVLLLHKLSDELRFVLIVALIRQIMQARLETSELEKNFKILPNLTDLEKQDILKKIENGLPPAWIVADEAQNFLPSERQAATSGVLIRLVREGRNFGVSFMLTTQQPSAIDQRILAQVDTLIAHKLTVQKDIDYVRQNLKSTLPSEVTYANNSLSFDDLIRVLDTGQAIVSNTDTDRTFIMDVRPRVSAHGGFGA